MSEADSTRRPVHVVLVPGFGGFDILGQMEYYAGITPLFQAWQATAPERPTVLRYFGNLPTAGVCTRAERLKGYLAKRIARGEVVDGDRIALVGHSTGGLDIRQLLSNLEAGNDPIPVDGVTVEPSQILSKIDRVVFLSVPHHGTNIANWVKAHSLGRRILVEQLRASVAAADASSILDRAEACLAGMGAGEMHADALLAVQDALRDMDGAAATLDPAGVARAHEASAHLRLWLRHIASDFSAIDDLTVKQHPAPSSPAHFVAAARTHEQSVWARHRIRALSFATRGPAPPRFVLPKTPGRLWDPFATCSSWLPDDRVTDVPYRACYHATAQGPFAGQPTGSFHPLSDPSSSVTVAPWENDGIVNTASMWWPTGPNLLVDGDHGDIIGHYALARPASSAGRRGAQQLAYDLLRSSSGFDSAVFRTVWSRVFTFCLT